MWRKTEGFDYRSARQRSATYGVLLLRGQLSSRARGTRVTRFPPTSFTVANPLLRGFTATAAEEFASINKEIIDDRERELC